MEDSVRKTPVAPATEADIKEAVARYGQTIDELVAEAEAGYDPSKMRRIE